MQCIRRTLDNIIWDAACTQVQLALNKHLSHITWDIAQHLWTLGRQGHNLPYDIKSWWPFRDTWTTFWKGCTKGICWFWVKGVGNGTWTNVQLLQLELERMRMWLGNMLRGMGNLYVKWIMIHNKKSSESGSRNLDRNGKFVGGVVLTTTRTSLSKQYMLKNGLHLGNGFVGRGMLPSIGKRGLLWKHNW